MSKLTYPKGRMLQIRDCTVAICNNNNPGSVLLSVLLYWYEYPHKGDFSNEEEKTFTVCRTQSDIELASCNQINTKTIHDTAVPLLSLFGYITVKEKMNGNLYTVHLERVLNGFKQYERGAEALKSYLKSLLQLESAPIRIPVNELESVLINKRELYLQIERTLIAIRVGSHCPRGRKPKKQEVLEAQSEDAQSNRDSLDHTIRDSFGDCTNVPSPQSQFTSPLPVATGDTKDADLHTDQGEGLSLTGQQEGRGSFPESMAMGNPPQGEANGHLPSDIPGIGGGGNAPVGTSHVDNRNSNSQASDTQGHITESEATHHVPHRDHPVDLPGHRNTHHSSHVHTSGSTTSPDSLRADTRREDTERGTGGADGIAQQTTPPAEVSPEGDVLPAGMQQVTRPDTNSSSSLTPGQRSGRSDGSTPTVPDTAQVGQEKEKPPKRTRKPAQPKTEAKPKFVLTEQQQQFWTLWGDYWFNTGIPLHLSPKAYEHVCTLSPFITTPEHLDDLVKRARKDLEDMTGINKRSIQLGNLVYSLPGWRQDQQLKDARNGQNSAHANTVAMNGNGYHKSSRSLAAVLDPQDDMVEWQGQWMTVAQADELGYNGGFGAYL